MGRPSGPRLGEDQGGPPIQAWQGQRRPLRFRPGGAGETLGAQGPGRVEVGRGPGVQVEHRSEWLGRRASLRPRLGGVGGVSGVGQGGAEPGVGVTPGSKSG